MEASGIEPPATGAPIVVNSRENDATDATKGDAKRREVSASGAPGVVTAADVDAAIRTAAKVAIDAGDYRRVRTLLDLLESSASAESERAVRLLVRPADRLSRQATQSIEPTIATTNVPIAQKMSAHDEGPALGANGKSTASK